MRPAWGEERQVFPLDGRASEVRDTLAPPRCDAWECSRAFAILCLAASECAARFRDVLDLGSDADAHLCGRWAAVLSTLIAMAHWATPEAGDWGEPGPNYQDYLGAIFRLGEEHPERLREE